MKKLVRQQGRLLQENTHEYKDLPQEQHKKFAD